MKKHVVLSILVIAGVIGFSGMAQADLSDGLVAYYPFNGNANDESGADIHGTVNGATLSEDRFGNTNSAYRFDGIDDFIDVGDNLDQPNNNFSISAWFKTENITGISQYIVAKRSTAQGKGYSLNGINMSGYTDANILDEDSFTSALSVSSVNTNQWYHVVAIVDRINNNISLYIDSSFNSTIDSTNVYGDISNDLPFYIGAKSVNENYFHGDIDDIRIYNRVLSELEIQKLYNEGKETCDCSDSDGDGVPDAWDQCFDTPAGSCTDKHGCLCEGLYTEEQMNQMVSNILTWGDTNNDDKIGLAEAIRALRITSGAIRP